MRSLGAGAGDPCSHSASVRPSPQPVRSFVRSFVCSFVYSSGCSESPTSPSIHPSIHPSNLLALSPHRPPPTNEIPPPTNNKNKQTNKQTHEHTNTHRAEETPHGERHDEDREPGTAAGAGGPGVDQHGPSRSGRRRDHACRWDGLRELSLFIYVYMIYMSVSVCVCVHACRRGDGLCESPPAYVCGVVRRVAGLGGCLDVCVSVWIGWAGG
jgi:hypothetical protein